jgi:hypothetical protein
MARVSNGNPLTSPLQQPGAKVVADGYGLLAVTVTFKVDQSYDFDVLGGRGVACPIPQFAQCEAHKYNASFDSLGVATLSVDFVGIDLSVNSGLRTNPQVGGSQGLTSENITTHPNFFETASALGFSGSPIAGVGTGSLATPAYPAVAGVSDQYAGNNGATFEAAIGRKFLGFRKPEFKDFYGKSNYLAPQTSFSGFFYTSQSSHVTGLIERVGKTSGTRSFNSIDLLPSYMGSTFTIGGKNQLLLAQVNTEDFGGLFKVNYEIRYNREGYVASVYAAA